MEPPGKSGRFSADLRVGVGLATEDTTNRVRFVACFAERCGNDTGPTSEQTNQCGIQTRQIVEPAPRYVLDSAPQGSLARTGTRPFNYLLKRSGRGS